MEQILISVSPSHLIDAVSKVFDPVFSMSLSSAESIDLQDRPHSKDAKGVLSHPHMLFCRAYKVPLGCSQEGGSLYQMK